MWAALLGGFIGAGIPAVLTFMGLRRSRQSNDAEAFGPAMLLLHRLEPYQVMANVNPDPAIELPKWTELPELIETARERLSWWLRWVTHLAAERALTRSGHGNRAHRVGTGNDAPQAARLRTLF